MDEQRRLKEIYMAMYYTALLHHGTAGHNGYLVLADLAAKEGYLIDLNSHRLYQNGQVVLKLLET